MTYIFDVLIIIILFGFYGWLHSLLASTKIKKKISVKVGEYIAFYRFVYNITALLLLYFLYEISPKPDVILYDLNPPLDIIIFSLQVLSLAGILWSASGFCLKEFLGISQIIRWYNKEYNENELDERLTLRIQGAYRYSRHPVYFFIILFLALRPTMDLFYFTAFICITLYFFIGSFYEEEKLKDFFGDEYSDYIKKVPRIVPYKLFQPYY